MGRYYYPERRCQARNAHGSQCRNAAHEYVTVDPGREALLCREHKRLAREGQLRLCACDGTHSTAATTATP